MENQVCIYISRKHEKVLVIDIINRFVEFKNNVWIFFSTKGYEEYERETIKAFNSQNFKFYNLQPKLSNLYAIKLPFKKIYKSDVHNIGEMPIKLSTFEESSKYKKEKLSKSKLPMILGGDYYIVEFSEFIENENDHMDEIKLKFKHKDYFNDDKPIVSYIEYLKDYKEENLSKINLFAESTFFDEKDLTEIEKLDLKKRIYKYLYIRNYEYANRDGLFFIRRNGKLIKRIHFLIFENEDSYYYQNNSGYLEFELDNNLYYYTLKDKKNIKMTRFLKFTKDGNVLPQEIIVNNNPNDVNNPNDNLLVKTNENDLPKDYKNLVVLYVIKKSIYTNEKVFTNINRPTKTEVLRGGTVRLKGVKIIHIIQ